MEEINKTGKLSDTWLKASVVGSLWASVEIIIGSFFHNLRVPMAGTILAMISVVIMVAFHQRWKEKGLFWRAGLICALMKSISPSAILLGPMTGIFAEALLMELFTRIFGANLFGYLLGGAFALASTIAHKIVNLLIIYGMDFVTVLVNLYDFAVRQIGHPDLQPETALWVLFAIYAVMGIIAALTGCSLGHRSSSKKKGTSPAGYIEITHRKNYFSLETDQHFSVRLLFFHVFAIVVILFIFGSYDFTAGLVFMAAYVGFSIFHYKRAMKHLKRPFFWVQVVVLTFLATLFFNGFQQGNIFDPEGLMIGIKMNLRAVLILVGFSAVSVELRNPVVKTVLYRRGFSQLYLSLGLAFSALPAVIDKFSSPKQILKNPIKSIQDMITDADGLLEAFKKQNMKPSVVIITGEKHSGKTTFALELAQRLKDKDRKVGGFCALGTFEENRRVSFDILDLYSGKRKTLCSIHRENGEKIGPFRFDPAGQEFGFQLLSSEHIHDMDFVFVDEVGPLEMKGLGWAPAIDQLMEQSGKKLVLVVRTGLVDDVIRKWNLINVVVLKSGETATGDVMKKMIQQK